MEYMPPTKTEMKNATIVDWLIPNSIGRLVRTKKFKRVNDTKTTTTTLGHEVIHSDSFLGNLNLNMSGAGMCDIKPSGLRNT
jgi:hypothetical protein